MVPKSAYSPLQVFAPHVNALALSGCYGSRSALYRGFINGLIILYNVQHIIKFIQVRSNIDEAVSILFILLTMLNLFIKQCTFFFAVEKIDSLMNVIGGELFACHTARKETAMRKHAKEKRSLLRAYHVSIYVCGACWCMFPLVDRLLGKPVGFIAYFPFDTSPPFIFELCHLYMCLMITLEGYCNVSIDCTIATMYAQASEQLVHLRHDLRALADSVDDHSTLQGRFIRCTCHYEEIWKFVNALDSTFNTAQVVQLSTMVWVICMTVYKITEVKVPSAEFLSLAIYLICMMAQLFLFCYYGTRVISESNLVSEALYSSQWMDAPRWFRIQVLMYLCRCSRTIVPKAAFIVPLSLNTYIAVLRFSYTLFTLLKSSQ